MASTSDKYQVMSQVFAWRNLCWELYDQLKEWDKIHLFILSEYPSMLAFTIEFSKEYKLSISMMGGTIDTTLVDVVSNKLTHCDKLGYERIKCTKQFDNIDELKEELLRLHKLSN